MYRTGLTCKKDDRVQEMFKLETKDDNEAEALITESLTCPITVPKFQFIQPKHVGPKQNVSSVGGGAIIIKGAQIEKRQPKEPTAKDHLLHLTKDVQHTKNRHLENMW